jgi:hypothetical protein
MKVLKTWPAKLVKKAEEINYELRITDYEWQSVCEANAKWQVKGSQRPGASRKLRMTAVFGG